MVQWANNLMQSHRRGIITTLFNDVLFYRLYSIIIFKNDFVGVFRDWFRAVQRKQIDMSSIYQTRIVSFFNLICWIVTIILVSYWTYVYTLDDDLCIVDYKKYFENESDEFPVLSICLKNQISEGNLKSQNSEIDVETYIDFLSGKIFDEELAKINYENITIDVTKYLAGHEVVYKNGTRDRITQRQVLQGTYAFFYSGKFYQCY